MIALVAILSILLGVAAGYGLAPKVSPSPSPASITSSPVPSPSVSPSLAAAATDAPAGTTQIPPSGGLSIVQALEALRSSFGSPTSILSARVTHYPAVSKDWVWQIIVPYSTVDCGPALTPRIESPSASPGSTASGVACRTISTTEMVILDYRTGDLLEDRIPAG